MHIIASESEYHHYPDIEEMEDDITADQLLLMLIFRWVNTAATEYQPFIMEARFPWKKIQDDGNFTALVTTRGPDQYTYLSFEGNIHERKIKLKEASVA